MKFKEFILKTSVYSNDTIDNEMNDFFKGTNYIIIDVECSIFKECDSSNVIYIRVLVTYQEPLIISMDGLSCKNVSKELSEEEYKDEFGTGE